MSTTAAPVATPLVEPSLRRPRRVPHVARPATLAAAATFLAIALPLGMLGVVWPDARLELGRSLGSLGVVTSTYGLVRLLTATSGRPIARRVGMGRAFVAGLVGLAASGAALALAPTWSLFLAATVALAFTGGVVDSLVALYLSTRGDVADAGLVHGMFGVGASVGPLVVATLPGWRSALGAAVVATIAAMAVAVQARTSWPAPAGGQSRVVPRQASPPRRRVAVSVGVFVAAVAVEVTLGQWSYAWLTEARGVTAAAAALAVSAFWGGSTAVRLVMSRPRIAALIERWGLASSGVVAAAVLSTLAVLPALPDPVAVLAFGIMGVALAPVVPTLFAKTSARVGAAGAERIAGWQLLAFNVGAVGLTALTGVLVDGIGAGVVVPVVTTVLVTFTLPLLRAADRLHRGA
ncbi:MAG TPA: MFS transporter [Euzebyales bacterium]